MATFHLICCGCILIILLTFDLPSVTSITTTGKTLRVINCLLVLPIQQAESFKKLI